MSNKLRSLLKFISAIEDESCGQIELEDFILAISRASKVKDDIGAPALDFFISQLRIYCPILRSIADISIRPVKKIDVETVLSKALPQMHLMMKTWDCVSKKHPILCFYDDRRAASNHFTVIAMNVLLTARHR